jgi:hypothetical protein
VPQVVHTGDMLSYVKLISSSLKLPYEFVPRIVKAFAPACGLSMSEPFSEQFAVEDDVQLSYEYSQVVALPQSIDGSHLITVWSWVGRDEITSGTTLSVSPLMSVPEMKVAPVNALKMFVARL